MPTSNATPPMTMSEAIGGPRGIIDSSVPTVAFVIVNAEAGLTPGIVVAVVAAAGLLVLRIARREPTQQTFSGLFAVAFAAFIASRTGDSKGFFLPSIAKNAVGVVVALASVAQAATAERVGDVSTVFKFIGPNDKIVVEVFDDPKVSGVSCYLSRARTGGISGAFGVAEDTSDAAVACRQV